MRSGVRQGCLLPTILFNSLIEPFVQPTLFSRENGGTVSSDKEMPECEFTGDVLPQLSEPIKLSALHIRQGGSLRMYGLNFTDRKYKMLFQDLIC